jgi:amidophosphoribosyltransferase
MELIWLKWEILLLFKLQFACCEKEKKEKLLIDIYNKCKAQENFPKEDMKNHVKEIYSCFSAGEISDKISQLLTPKETTASVEIIYQSISDLHISCPEHLGDWYFTGNYPTPGGVKVVNKSYMNYIEGKKIRAY